MPRRHRVAAIAYRGLCSFEFGIAVEVFALPRPELGVPWYDFRVCAVEPGPLSAMGGFTIHAPHGIDGLSRADTIVVTGWRDIEEIPPKALLDAIRRASKRGARLVSICTGAFVLAAAGVLDGLRATTHWRYVDRLRERYPKIRVEPDVLYVDEGQVLTSAGSAAGLDVCLHVVRRDFGAKIANAVARRLVVPTHREGGQAQFVPRPVAADAQETHGQVLDWLRANLDRPHTITSMAKKARQSERTFLRHFRQATGESPHGWLIRERVARARELLETSQLNVDQIAERSGIGAVETLRMHFRAIVGVSPNSYRRAFRQ